MLIPLYRLINKKTNVKITNVDITVKHLYIIDVGLFILF